MAHTVYAVASGKGGVGKTATTVNLGAALAEQGHTVAIVDADLGMANLAGFLGLDPDGPTLHEVLAGAAPLHEAIYEIDAGLAAVPSGISLEGFADVETEALSEAIDGLRDSFDYVLLDLGAGLSHDTVLPLALADAVVLVSTPKPVALQDTAKTHTVTERLGGAVAGVVLTRAVDPGSLDVEAVSDRLGLPVLAVIPEDDAVHRSAVEGDPVVATDPETPASDGFRGLADIVIAESLTNAPVVPGTGGPPGREEPSARDAARGPSQGAGQDAGEPGTAGETDTAPSAPDATATDEDSTRAPDEASARTPGDGPRESPAGFEQAPGDAGATDEAADRDEELVGMDVDVDTAAEEIAEAIGQDPNAPVEEGIDVQFGADHAAEEPETVPQADGEAVARGGTGPGDDLREYDGPDPDEGPDEHADPGTTPEADGEIATDERPAPDPETVEDDAPFSVEGAEPEDDDDDSSGGLLSRLFG